MRRLFGAVVVISSLGLVGEASADTGTRAAHDTERGEQQFQRGTAAFEAQRYSEAYASLRSAFDLAPSYRTAAGLGQVELHLGQYRDAAEHLSLCLRRFPADGDPRVRAHIEDGLAEAREHVAALRVRVNVEGAALAVDGTAVGTSPLEGLLFVEPGRHDVTATRGTDATRAPVDARVRATEEVALSLPLENAPPAPTPLPTPSASTPAGVETPAYDSPPASHGLPPSTVALIVGGSLTAVALGTAIAYGVKGHSASNDAASQRDAIAASGGSCNGASASADCTELHGLYDDRNDFNRVALVAGIGTGVFAAATAVTFVVLRSHERAHQQASRPLSVGFRGTAGGGFLSVSGGF